MEELPRQPLVGGIEEQRGGEHDARPLRPAIAGEQEDGDRAARLGEHLHDEQEDRARAEPVEGHQEQQEDVGVVAEELEAAERDEGVPDPGQQPRALVVDAEVEAEGPPTVEALHWELDELDRPGDDEDGEHALRESPAGDHAGESRFAGPGRCCVGRRHRLGRGDDDVGIGGVFAGGHLVHREIVARQAGHRPQGAPPRRISNLRTAARPVYESV